MVNNFKGDIKVYFKYNVPYENEICKLIQLICVEFLTSMVKFQISK